MQYLVDITLNILDYRFSSLGVLVLYIRPFFLYLLGFADRLDSAEY